MEEQVVPDGETQPDPDSPGPEEMPTPDDAAVDGGPPDADDDDHDTREKTGDDGDGGSPDQGDGGAFDKLLAKYDGDKTKLADAYFEQAKSNARLWERLQAIEEYVKGSQPKEPEVDEEQLVAEDSDVKEIVKDYNDTQAEIRTAQTRQNQLISEYGTLEKKIERLEGKLEAASEFEVKQEIRDQLGDLKAEQKSVRSDIKGSQSDIQRLTKDLKDLHRKYRDAAARAKDGVSRQRQADLERRQEAISTRQEFAEAMRGEAVRFGIPVESKQYAVLFQSINDRIYSYLSRLPKGAPGVDIGGAVKVLMGEYADTMGLKPKFKSESDAKRAAVSPSVAKETPGGTKVAKEPPPPKDGRWTKEFVQERARRLLG